MQRCAVTVASVCAVLTAASEARAEVRSVRLGETLLTPCAAFAVAPDGDTIEIGAAGSYVAANAEEQTPRTDPSSGCRTGQGPNGTLWTMFASLLIAALWRSRRSG